MVLQQHMRHGAGWLARRIDLRSAGILWPRIRTRRRIQPRQPRRDRRSEEHTFELQSLRHLVCRLLLEKKKKKTNKKLRRKKKNKIAKTSKSKNNKTNKTTNLNKSSKVMQTNIIRSTRPSMMRLIYHK